MHNNSTRRSSSRNRMYRWALRVLLALILLGILCALVLLTSGGGSKNANRVASTTAKVSSNHRTLANAAAEKGEKDAPRILVEPMSPSRTPPPRDVYHRVCEYVNAVSQPPYDSPNAGDEKGAHGTLSTNRTEATNGPHQRTATKKRTTVFFGDSVALQSLRLSALVVAHCWHRNGLLTDAEMKNVIARVAELHRRIGDMGEMQSLFLRVGAQTTSADSEGGVGDTADEASPVTPARQDGEGGDKNYEHRAAENPRSNHSRSPFVWELRFRKVQHFTQFATDFAVRRMLAKSCATPSHSQVLMSGNWDMIRPTMQADKLTLEYFDFLEESDLWGRFLANYSLEVTSAARHLTAILNFSCTSSSSSSAQRRPVVVVVPPYPNCSAPKFDPRIVLNAKKPDPYRFLKGPMCPLLVWQGTAWKLRQAMLLHANLSTVATVVDADRLVTKMRARALGRFATQDPHHMFDSSSDASQPQPSPPHEDAGAETPSCELTDGTHFDVQEAAGWASKAQLGGRYRCAFELIASLWALPAVG